MRLLLIFIFVIFSSKGYTQNNVTTTNQTDKNGLKQGQWINQKIDTMLCKGVAISIIDRVSISKLIYDTIIIKYIYWKGYFFDNKKDSVWMVYATVKENLNSKNDRTIIGDTLYKAKFKNDYLDGILITYYSNQVLKSEIEFKNGVANGQIKCYYPNGQIKYTGFMRYGDEYFTGAEYSKDGYKIRDRKFNYELTLKEWTDLEDLYKRISNN